MARRAEARLYRGLLRLYPGRLRRERGEEMLALYRALSAEAAARGRRARLGFALRMVRDLVSSLPAEHHHARRARRALRAGERRRMGGMLESALQDVRFALRSFARVPAFTAATVATLAIGIGATTTMFGVVDGILLRPLPYEGAGPLIQIGLRFEDYESSATGPSDYFDLAERSRTLEAVAVSRLQWLDFAGDGDPERLDAAGVSHAFFDVLGTAPALGRGFTAADDTRAGEALVILSDGLWRRRFAASRDAIGRTLILDDEPYTVVGVMPAAFRPPEAIHQREVELWFPLGRIDDPLDGRGDAFMQMIGRGRTGSSVADVRAELTTIGARLGEEFPDVGVRDFWVADLRDRTVGESRRFLWLLLGAVGLVLVIACANVANLWLVRATERTRELAVRAALGAGRARVARQLLTESVLVALAGGILGALLARAGLAAFRAIAPADVPRLAEIAMDMRVLAFALTVSLVTGIVFGVAPLMVNGRGTVAERLRAAAGAAGTRGGHRLRGAFVAGQIALALVLLSGAGLLVNDFVRLSTTEPGFEPDGVAWVDVAPPSRRYTTAAARSAFFASALAQVRALPGVRSAGAINGLPLDPNRDMRGVLPETRPVADALRTTVHAVTPGYFATLGIPLLQGRDVADGDRPGGDAVAVVNATFARTVWPGDAPLGRRFRFAGDEDAPWITVVGVAGDVRHYGLAEAPQAMAFLPIAQYPRTWLSFGVRHDGPAAPLLRAMREALWRLDPALPLDDAGTAGMLLAGSLVQERFRTLLLATFAAVALSLTFVGLSGTMTHIVRARRREMGIRLTLGATPRDVRHVVVRGGMAIAGLGLLLGIPAALLSARLLAGFVFGISTSDPLTFAAVAAFVAAVALLACWVPARRAAAVDPVHTLRAD